MDQDDFQELKRLFKKHLAMAKKSGWKVRMRLDADDNILLCPFWHSGTVENTPTFARQEAVRENYGRAARLWNDLVFDAMRSRAAREQLRELGVTILHLPKLPTIKRK